MTNSKEWGEISILDIPISAVKMWKDYCSQLKSLQCIPVLDWMDIWIYGYMDICVFTHTHTYKQTSLSMDIHGVFWRIKPSSIVTVIVGSNFHLKKKVPDYNLKTWRPTCVSRYITVYSEYVYILNTPRKTWPDMCWEIIKYLIINHCLI